MLSFQECILWKKSEMLSKIDMHIIGLKLFIIESLKTTFMSSKGRRIK